MSVGTQIDLTPEADVSAWNAMDDAQFLKSITWKRGTSPGVVQAAKIGNIEAFALAVTSTWFREPTDDRMLKPPVCRANWSIGAFDLQPREVELSELLEAQRGQRAKKGAANKSPRRGAVPVTIPLENWWLKYQPVELSMWEVLALLESLPYQWTHLSPSTAFQIWRRLLTIAGDWNQLRPIFDVKSDHPRLIAEVARYGYEADPYLDLSLIRHCELPWLTGLIYSAVKGSDKLRKAAAELLESEMVERTDDQGVPGADLLPRWGMWLAVFVRILWTSREWSITLWDSDANDLYLAMIEKTAPMIQPNGRFAFGRINIADSTSFIEHAFRAADWSDADAALRGLFTLPRRGLKQSGTGKIGTPPAPPTPRKNPLEICIPPSNQSDAAAWAVMRTHWGAHADRVTILHDRDALNLELSVQGQSLLEGEWQGTLINSTGKRVPLRGDWTCVCWQSDPDSDYIELQLIVPGVVRVERQVFLSRTMQFCLLGESLSELKMNPVDFHSQLPLLPQVEGQTDALTREIRLTANGLPIRVFPVGLPAQHTHSSLGKFGKDLSLNTLIGDTAWYNPMIIDWSPARRNSEAIWKALTVAEERQAVKRDEAAGYRLKLGDQQWLMYRSLKQSIEPRSVLGLQTRYETVIGSVEKNGNITPLMQVE